MYSGDAIVGPGRDLTEELDWTIPRDCFAIHMGKHRYRYVYWSFCCWSSMVRMHENPPIMWTRYRSNQVTSRSGESS